MNKLESYYNKFNEEKRLNSRHGQVEFQISMHYIHEYLPKDKMPSEINILDVGAGTGRYTIPLYEEGYDITAVEPVQHNLGRLKKKNPNVTAFKGNALRMKRLKDDTFDLCIVFGPMYHLLKPEEKLQALLEVKRVTKPGGILMVAYVMNEYGMVTYGFKERHILEVEKTGRIDDTFKILPQEEDLYDYVRLENINDLNEKAGLERIKILSPDGPANYMRPFLNQLSEEEFQAFVRYQMSVCERPDLIGAGAHTVDILKKK